MNTTPPPVSDQIQPTLSAPAHPALSTQNDKPTHLPQFHAPSSLSSIDPVDYSTNNQSANDSRIQHHLPLRARQNLLLHPQILQ